MHRREANFGAVAEEQQHNREAHDSGVESVSDLDE